MNQIVAFESIFPKKNQLDTHDVLTNSMIEYLV